MKAVKGPRVGGDPVQDYLGRVDPNRLGMSVESKFGPGDIIAGAFPLARVLSPAARAIGKYLGLGSSGAAKTAPKTMFKARQEAIPTVDKADRLISESQLEEAAKRVVQDYGKFPDVAVRMNPKVKGVDPGGKAFFRALRESDNPTFKKMLNDMRADIYEEFVSKYGRDKLRSDDALTEQMELALDGKLEKFILKEMEKQSSVPGLNYITQSAKDPSTPFYAPYQLNANGGKIKNMKAKKRKVTRGTYDVEVDGKEYQVEGKRIENRGGRVTKFKAKGEGDGFKIKIQDKLKKGKSGLVKKDKKRTKYK